MKAPWAATLLLASSVAIAEPLTLSAKAGQFQSVVSQNAASRGEVDATIRMKSIKAGHRWAPGAFLGFQEGAGQYPLNSIQFFLVRNKPTDQFLLAGYRTIKNGSIIEHVSLSKSTSLTSSITFHVHFNKGTFIVSVDGSAPTTITTGLNKVNSYFSANSCTAEFTNITSRSSSGERIEF